MHNTQLDYLIKCVILMKEEEVRGEVYYDMMDRKRSTLNLKRLTMLCTVKYSHRGLFQNLAVPVKKISK